ncbi:MAG: peptide-methionine (S)-S-oxide reductase [Synergistaceae bacterium]|nr:peptide-methionine (S)-S-oxide reductase [Synergistaceae bacterium]
MIRTRVGYAGGTTPNPTYDDIGDHTETIQVDFDPEVVSYEDLLAVFWRGHNPSLRGWSTQYRSAVFTDGEEQRSSAEQSLAREVERTRRRVETKVEELREFFPAEDYHQKFYLRQDRELMAHFNALYPDGRDLMNSPAAAKVNGFLSGLGSREHLERVLPLLGLAEETGRRLLVRVR